MRAISPRHLEWTLHLFHEVGSTNHVAKELARKGAPEGTVVVSTRQSMGRGRLGRQWVSPRGGLWASLLLRPGTVRNLGLIPIVAGVAVAKAVEEIAHVKVGLKWPNDLVVANRKLGGILVESCYSGTQLEATIVGIGINVQNSSLSLPEGLSTKAISLSDVGRDVSELDLLQSIVEHIEPRYQLYRTGKTDSIRREWQQLSMMIGKKFPVKTASEIYEGLATGIDADGALLVKLSTGSTVRILSSESFDI